eukprot:4225336-Ditylum_brightwellii.AAC.1
MECFPLHLAMSPPIRLTGQFLHPIGSHYCHHFICLHQMDQECLGLQAQFLHQSFPGSCLQMSVSRRGGQ